MIYAFVPVNPDGTLGGGYPFVSTNFDSVASGNLSVALAQNVLALVNQYGFDGVDVDWEIPQTSVAFDHVPTA